MPWTCCGAEQKDDAQKCPSCGKAKNKWTMRLGRTRVFSLRKPLVDEEWDLEALDFTGGSSFGSVSVEGDGPAESTREEEDEDWELEALDALPADADEEVRGGGGGAPALAGVSSRGEDAGPGATSEADADAGTD